jgi:3-hydroxyisobutyrate dehydrogenase
MAENVRSVGLLGAGIMGAAMGRNLVEAGLEVRVWNRSREKAEAVEGAEVADSPADAVRGADAAMTVLSDGDAVRDVMGGDGGGLEAMEPGAIWIQASTVGVAASEELAELAAARRIAFIDSPVLGTRTPAEKGELVVLASGRGDEIERCRPVFEAVGAKTIELGAAGAATRMKLVVNNWLIALTATLAESMALAEALKLDPERFLEILDGNPVGSPYAQLKGKVILGGEYEPASFPLKLAAKDARLVIDAAREAGFEPSLIETALRRFTAAEEMGQGELDMAAVYEAIGERADDRPAAAP